MSPDLGFDGSSSAESLAKIEKIELATLHKSIGGNCSIDPLIPTNPGKINNFVMDTWSQSN